MTWLDTDVAGPGQHRMDIGILVTIRALLPS